MTITAQGAPLHDDALSEFDDIAALRSGRHATVYRARERATGRDVALKVIDHSERTPFAREAFDRETAAFASLGTHPNIVTLYRRLDLTDGRIALVLELCNGSIAGAPQSGPERSARAVELGIKIAGALETAHHGGVLHRDVRPQNILLTALGEPALSDFGMAALQHGTQDQPTLMQFATVHTAPELIEGSPGTEATDVYGLASTLYEFITGAPAFPRYQDGSQAAALLRVLRDPVAPIISPDVPLALSDVLLWAMAKDPAERPPGAGWLADEFARIAARNGWPRTRLLVRDPPEALQA